MKRNLEIDRLRAIAVLMTMFAHFDAIGRGEASWFPKAIKHIMGVEGVILFFAISGYVISTTLIPKIDQCLSYGHYKHTFLSFWLKRFTRITPMSVLWIILPLLATVFINQSGIWGVLLYNVQGAIASFINLFNIFNIFDNGKSIYGIYWSLSLEEQFYLVFPFFLFLFKTNNQRIVALIFSMLLLDLVPDSIRPGFRFEAITLGVLLYILINKYDAIKDFKINKFIGITLSTFLIFAILLSPVYLSGIMPVSFYEPLDALFPTILVYFATKEEGLILPIKPLEKILDWIGTRSYGIYLIHLPAASLAFCFLYQTPYNTVLNRFSLSLIIGVTLTELCYRYFETPIRNYGKNLSNSILVTSNDNQLVPEKL